jgi:molybdate transport system substrate-binding protein
MPPATLTIWSTLAVKGVIDELMPHLEAVSGGPISLSYDPTAVTLEKIRAGARGDAVILTEQGIEALTAEGILMPGSRFDLARSLVGLAVRSGAPKPDISTLEAFTHTLRSARSLVYSRGGASGIFFAGLLERLGLAEIVNAKATIIPSGFTAELTARGEADIAIQQVSELMAVPGVEIVGPLPQGAQESLLFAGALFADSGNAHRARAFLSRLADPAAAAIFARKGLLPVAAQAASD